MTHLPSPTPSTSAAPAVALSGVGLDRLNHRHKQAHDTASGCRTLAANDLVRAGGMETERGRAKLEHSAATWSARADMLQRLDESAEARKQSGKIPLVGLVLAGALAVAGCGASPEPQREAAAGAVEKHLAERENDDAEVKAAVSNAAEDRANADVDRYEAAEKRAGRGS